MRAERASLVLAAIVCCAWTPPPILERPPVEVKLDQSEIERAKERLAKARDVLKATIAQLEKKKAGEPEFKSVQSAADGLKAALDDGNDVEAEDLPYARMALEGRRELRSARERLESRRTELKVEVARDDVEAALADLQGA